MGIPQSRFRNSKVVPKTSATTEAFVEKSDDAFSQVTAESITPAANVRADGKPNNFNSIHAVSSDGLVEISTNIKKKSSQQDIIFAGEITKSGLDLNNFLDRVIASHSPCRKVGSTLCLVNVIPAETKEAAQGKDFPTIQIASIGDSQAVLFAKAVNCANRFEYRYHSIALNKPDIIDGEAIKEIKARGGDVYEDLNGNLRIFDHGLNMSASIGDSDGKGLRRTALVQEVDLNSLPPPQEDGWEYEDIELFMASDGFLFSDFAIDSSVFLEGGKGIEGAFSLSKMRRDFDEDASGEPSFAQYAANSGFSNGDNQSIIFAKIADLKTATSFVVCDGHGGSHLDGELFDHCTNSAPQAYENGSEVAASVVSDCAIFFSDGISYSGLESLMMQKHLQFLINKKSTPKPDVTCVSSKNMLVKTNTQSH